MHQIRIDDLLSWLFYKPFFHELHSALIIHLHRVTKNRLNPKEHQSPKYTHRICREVREVRSSTNLEAATEQQRNPSHFISLQEDIKKESSNFICLYVYARGETHLSAQMCSLCHLAALQRFEPCESAEELDCGDVPRQFQFPIKLLRSRALFHCIPDANSCALLSLGGEPSTKLFLLLPICLAWFCTSPYLLPSAPRGLRGILPL